MLFLEKKKEERKKLRSITVFLRDFKIYRINFFYYFLFLVTFCYYVFADTANKSFLKQSSSSFPGYFFDPNDPNVDVQDTIKANYITLATGSAIPSLFCKDRPADCNPGKVEVYLGAV